MLPRVKSCAVLVALVALYLGAGKFIGDMTRGEIPLWYAGLVKPPLNPPDIAFGIVWTILYVIMAIAGWRLWDRKEIRNRKCCLVLFAIQTGVNWAWSYIFFYCHLTGFAFLWLLALIALVAALLYKSDRMTRLLLTPYLAWICFASYLNGAIWFLNR